ncbi:54S ribosomal protein L3 mitochondrial [Exophiala sideris]|uniref:Large ribosomal subunit protein mL44 n=1 Tax=Exophiala sideris TaxID=1016849 RepID=A0ABR0JQ62_9EURO|nr:54S ribosomal protein L3 mitochondrial [Exophiala sideris]KAK5041280.1 54S ribosomal protein L3 mitochondrial [Exophiala sideris]KAK5068106.1 54S ribosomal protein L3 mitochondrial [Exophiala sideris]KAK5187407.1 54S ribosomal protein L3 mitochondrial [Eurotiomycetes sp. CCFEE 6388]
MKRLRLLRWSGSVLSPRTRPESLQSAIPNFRRCQATAALQSEPHDDIEVTPFLSEDALTSLPSPPVTAAKTSAKLAALHARLSLPRQLPLETLARTLVDESADPSVRFNNRPFAVLGNDLLGYYTSEHILSQYPRLPMAVVFAAMYAYHGPATLTAVAREWGVEAAAEPGGEVDPGLLQFKRLPPGPRPEQPDSQVIETREEGKSKFRRTMSSRAVYDDQFGEVKKRDEEIELKGVTLQRAATQFVRSVFGAVYLHAGRTAVKQLYNDHITSRQVNIGNLFQFKNPTKDLSRLCAREGFQAPVAKILSETGRKSRTPVFVVGIFSGSDMLGEGAGASLDEARTRAAVAAMKGWYLYSPTEVRLPSEMEEPGAKPWTPILVDAGEIAN